MKEESSPSPSRIKSTTTSVSVAAGKRFTPSSPLQRQHIPFRSAGGASTGSFAVPRVHHYIPPSPLALRIPQEKMSTVPNHQMEKSLDFKSGSSSSGVTTNSMSREDEERVPVPMSSSANSDSQCISDDANVRLRDQGPIPVEVQPTVSSSSEKLESDPTARAHEDSSQNNEEENGESNTDGMSADHKISALEEPDKINSGESGEDLEETDRNNALQSISSNENDRSEQQEGAALHIVEVPGDYDVGGVSGVNTSFASDFSNEIEKLTVMQNNSSPYPATAQLISTHEESKVKSSTSIHGGENIEIGVESRDNEESSNIGGVTNAEDDEIYKTDAMRSPWGENTINAINACGRGRARSMSESTATSIEVKQNDDAALGGVIRSPWDNHKTTAINACGGESELSMSESTATSIEVEKNEDTALGAIRSPRDSHKTTAINAGRGESALSVSESTATSIEVEKNEDTALGAIRSPWANNNNNGSVGSSTVTSVNDINVNGNRATRSLSLDFLTPQKDIFDTLKDEDRLGTQQPTPWNKYLEEKDNSIQPIDAVSSDISSISNQSSLTHSSASTCISNQSPSLQHLEYLARNSTAAHIMNFAPEEKKSRPKPCSNHSSDRLSITEIREVYGCKNRREAMKLAIDQSNCLSAASNVLVDLLFQYVQQHCEIRRQQLFNQDDGEEEKGRTKSKSTKGLSLPASAIGWLSSYIYPDESDNQYHQQWEDQENTSLPNASPAPRVQNKLSLLKVLLAKHVTHVRVTGAPWPGPIKIYKKKSANKGQSFETPRRRGRMLLNVDAQSASSFLRFFRALQNNPRVDMRLFPNVEYFQIDGIPPEWIQNLSVTSDTLNKMTIQRGCLSNFSTLMDIDATHARLIESSQGKAHKAIFESGAYDDILGIATKQASPLLKVSMEPEECDNQDSIRKQANEAFVKPTLFPLLKFLTLSRCGIGELSNFMEIGDATQSNVASNVFTNECSNVTKRTTLSFLEGLVTLDLSHNEFVSVKSALSGLDRAPALTTVDLSFNNISSMKASHLLVGNIKVLLLANNCIIDVQGLDHLYSLQKLDLQNNRISKLCDVSALARLPELMELNLKGNPFASKAKGGKHRYRIQVFSLFKECRVDTYDTGYTYRELMNCLPRLDGIDATKKDLVMIKYLSFSQSVRDIVPDNIEHDVQHDDENEASVVLARQILEPFREDYENELLLQASSPNRRQVKRIVPRKAAVIGNMNSPETPTNIMNIQQRTGKISKVKLQKLNRRMRNVGIIPQMYVSLENVIQSIVPDSIEENVEGEPKEIDNSIIEDFNSSTAESQMNPDEAPIAEPNIDMLCAKYTEGQSETSVCVDTNVFDKPNTSMDEYITKQIGQGVALKNLREESNERPNIASPVTKLNDSSQHVNENDENISLCPTEIIDNRNVIDEDQTSEFEALRSEKNEIISLSLIPDPVDNCDDDGFAANEMDDQEVRLRIDFASAEQSSVYNGPDSYSELCVAQYFELYFRCYVFPSSNHNESIDLYEDSPHRPSVPQVQLYQSDRDLMMWTLRQNATGEQKIGSHLHASNENLVMVSKEHILPCGLGATTRIQTSSTDVRGFKGQILYSASGKSFSISRSQELIFCVTSEAVYFFPDFGGKSINNPNNYRRFPSPIPDDATFADALWPHAYCRHPLKHLKKITFDGFGFQRLTLYFKLPALRGAIYAQPENGLSSAFDYTYVLFTCNQKQTIKLLQNIQEAAKEASPLDNTETSTLSMVENDNNRTIQAMSCALTRTNWGDDILFYQILHQSWESDETEDARRSFVLTNEEVFLFNETYAGDASECALEEDASNIRFGDISMRTIASAHIKDVTDVSIAKDDPKMITLVIKSQTRLRRPTSWILKCKDNENAERLVESLRNLVDAIN